MNSLVLNPGRMISSTTAVIRQPGCDMASALQLGQPTTNTKLLQICDSQDVRNPFKIVRDPDNLETNCWHRCTSRDRVSNAAREWMRDIINEVMDDLQNTIRILWCVNLSLIHI